MTNIYFEFDINEYVFDKLTGREAKIVGQKYHKGVDTDGAFHVTVAGDGFITYMVDNNYAGGIRNPWDLEEL